MELENGVFESNESKNNNGPEFPWEHI